MDKIEAIREFITTKMKFGYDEETGEVYLTNLEGDIRGVHTGNHIGLHTGLHEGDLQGTHLGNHFGVHEGNHWGIHKGRHYGLHEGDHIGEHIGLHEGDHIGQHLGVREDSSEDDEYVTELEEKLSKLPQLAPQPKRGEVWRCCSTPSTSKRGCSIISGYEHFLIFDGQYFRNNLGSPPHKNAVPIERLYRSKEQRE